MGAKSWTAASNRSVVLPQLAEPFTERLLGGADDDEGLRIMGCDHPFEIADLGTVQGTHDDGAGFARIPASGLPVADPTAQFCDQRLRER